MNLIYSAERWKSPNGRGPIPEETRVIVLIDLRHSKIIPAAWMPVPRVKKHVLWVTIMPMLQVIWMISISANLQFFVIIEILVGSLRSPFLYLIKSVCRSQRNSTWKEKNHTAVEFTWDDVIKPYSEYCILKCNLEENPSLIQFSEPLGTTSSGIRSTVISLFAVSSHFGGKLPSRLGNIQSALLRPLQHFIMRLEKTYVKRTISAPLGLH